MSINAGEVLGAIHNLVQAGLLSAWRVPTDGIGERAPIDELTYEDREVYGGDDGVTFEDHVEGCDYGPHEFRATPEGKPELAKAQYDQHDKRLGWR